MADPTPAPAAPDRIAVEFTLLEEDVNELLKWLGAANGPNSLWLRATRKQQVIRSLKQLPLVIGGGAGVFWVLGHEVLPGVLIGSIIWLLMFTSAAQRATHASELRSSQHEQWKPWLHSTPRRVTVSAMGLELVKPDMTTSIRWSGVRNVRRWHNLLVIELCDPGGIFIPVRCFRDEAEAVRFTELAVREGRVAGSRDLTSLLSQHDFRCPVCRYLLRGNTTGSCPECGRQVLVEEVELWLGMPR